MERSCRQIFTRMRNDYRPTFPSLFKDIMGTVSTNTFPAECFNFPDKFITGHCPSLGETLDYRTYTYTHRQHLQPLWVWLFSLLYRHTKALCLLRHINTKFTRTFIYTGMSFRTGVITSQSIPYRFSGSKRKKYANPDKVDSAGGARPHRAMTGENA